MALTAEIEEFVSGYDVSELESVIEYVRRARKQEAVAAVEVSEQEEAEPQGPVVETWTVDRFVPWDFRLNAWMLRQVGRGTRDGIHTPRGDQLWMPRRALLWCIMAWPRLRQMLWIVRSGKAPHGAGFERDGICSECPSLKIDRKGHKRCGSCRCPDWHASRLHVKNRFAANHCPEKRHPGAYMNLITHKWPNRKPQEPQKPAGRGCGG